MGRWVGGCVGLENVRDLGGRGGVWGMDDGWVRILGEMGKGGGARRYREGGMAG